MKKQKSNPYLSKKELADLRKAQDKLIAFQKELEKMKEDCEAKMNKNDLPIIFKDNNG